MAPLKKVAFLALDEIFYGWKSPLRSHFILDMYI